MARSKFSYSADSYRIEYINGTHPAISAPAGADRTITITVPNGATWEVINIFQNCNTTATVGTRTPQLRITNNAGTNTYFLRISAVTAAASNFLNLNWGIGLTETAAGVGGQVGSMPIPAGMVLFGGDKIALNLVGGVDAADPHIVTAIIKEFT